MEPPPIQYTKTKDGVRIALWTMGQGDVPLIMSAPLGWSNISLEYRFPELLIWYERLAASRRVVRYDERCQGLSERGIDRMTEEDFASDAEAVIERLDAGQVDLLGVGGSGPPLICVAANKPDVVRKLILWNPYLRGHAELDHPRMLAVRSLIERDWELFTETYAGSSVGWKSSDAHAYARFIRMAVTQEDAARMFDAVSQFDATPWLERVTAPTLIVHDARSLADPQGPREVAALLPNARLVEVGGKEPSFRNEPGTRAIEAFLSEGEPPRERDLPSGTAIILFADIADSTALTERLGDAAFRERARGLDEALRKAIASNGGAAIEGKLLGGGVLAVFGAAREAIACAQTCHGAGGHAGLPLHIGVHAGDVIREEGNVYGGAVNIAARAAGEAAAGETLVSGTVRDLARTSAGVSFEARGERELKGVSEAVRVWAVR